MNNAYGPYSPFRTVDNLVLTSGQIGAVKGRTEPDIESQVAAALENLESVLKEAGSGLGQVVKTTVYLTNMDHYAAMNSVYADVFAAHGAAPARTCIAVSELPRVADHALIVEIEAIATLEVAM